MVNSAVPGRGALSGLGVAVTRGEGEEGPLSRILRDRGARVLDWGTVGFVPPDDLCPLYSALIQMDRYDWVCFSSPRAVQAVVSRVPGPPETMKVAAVGPSTAAALEDAGWPVHRVPSGGSGEALVEAFRRAGDAAGARIFFPASAIAREVIPDGLTALGAQVDRRTAYGMELLAVDAEACRRSVDEGEVQVVTFASPSAMEGLRTCLGPELFSRLARDLPAAAMGPTTAEALRQAGWKRVSVAKLPTMEGLADAAEAATALAPQAVRAPVSN